MPVKKMSKYAKKIASKIHEAPIYTIENASELITFVDKQHTWKLCEKRLLEATIIGVDTETKPVFQKCQKPNPCSLIQIAMRDSQGKEEVFILDLLHLQPKQYNATLSKLFLSKKIIKLGQGFFNDMKELAASYPKATCFTVAKSVVEVNDLSICVSGAHHPISLQKLVFYYLHKKLRKTQQTSNWNRRPLTANQLHYAASDALVLIHLYDVLVKKLTQKGKNLTKVVDKVSKILDVNVVTPTRICTLCFEHTPTEAKYKAHRKICYQNIRTLAVCKSCGNVRLETESSMSIHMEACVEEDYTVDLEEVEEEEISIETQQRTKRLKICDESSIEGSRRRKMSEIMASDDIWNQMSIDCGI